MKIHQSTDIDEPTSPRQVANKQYVDRIAAAASGAAPVFITDITNAGSGIVGNKQYVANTVPANAVISSAVTDDNTVAISVVAEGGSGFYSPVLTVSGSPALVVGEGSTITLAADQYDKRTFVGAISIEVSATTVVTVKSDTGASASVTINKAAAGPEISGLTIGAYPESQTAVRSGQIVSFSGTVDNTATVIDVIDAGAAAAKAAAATFGAADSAGTGKKTFSGSFVVSARTGTPATISARAKNSLGTAGTDKASANTIVVDQVLPAIGTITVKYPGVQEAIKGTEQATVTFTLANATTSAIAVSGVVSLLSGSESLATTAVVQGTGQGDVLTGTNIAVTATKPSNGSTASANALVKVVNTVHTNAMSIAGSPSRLVSSPSGQSYVVYIESSADVIGSNSGQSAYAPTFSGGQLSNITRVNSRRWTATLTVTDATARGTAEFTDISTTGLSGIQVTTATGTSYTVGGFTERTLAIPLQGDSVIGRTVSVGTSVGDVTKLVASLSGTPLTFVTNVDDAPLSFTIVDKQQGFTLPYSQVAQYKADGSIFYLNDRDQAGANTTGTMTITVREDA